MATMTQPAIKTDSEIRQDVMNELKWDPKILSPDIAVAVQEGVVTLSGFVSTYMEKEEAEKAVKRVYGVRAVANDLRVKPLLSRSDPEIARDAADALETHILVPHEHIKVTVRDGWLTLEGEVNWQFQKNLAESAVKSLKGVIGISNNIQVRPKVSPSQIRDKIEEALRRNAELDARRVEVDVDGSTVILRGTVRSWAERDEAEEAAWKAPGVTKVDNKIVVHP